MSRYVTVTGGATALVQEAVRGVAGNIGVTNVGAAGRPLPGVVVDVVGECVSWLMGRKEDLTRAEYDLIVERCMRVDESRFKRAFERLVEKEQEEERLIAEEARAASRFPILPVRHFDMDDEIQDLNVEEEQVVVVVEPVIIDGNDDHVAVSYSKATVEGGRVAVVIDHSIVKRDTIPASFVDSCSKEPTVQEQLTLASSLDLFKSSLLNGKVSEFFKFLKSPIDLGGLSSPPQNYFEVRDTNDCVRFEPWTCLEVDTLADLPIEEKVEYLTVGKFSTMRICEFLRLNKRLQSVHQFVGDPKVRFSNCRILLCDDRDWELRELPAILYSMVSSILVGPVVVYIVRDFNGY
jgi:hypothetical protein